MGDTSFNSISVLIMDMNKKIYIPDPKKWMRFYTQIKEGNVNPYRDHAIKGYQRGGGLRSKTSPYMISIDKYAKDLDDRDKKLTISMTSPAEQIVEQAKSEIEREKNIKKDQHGSKRRSQKSNATKEGPTAKKSKVVKLKSDVFGIY